jgi:hypothetical protein
MSIAAASIAAPDRGEVAELTGLDRGGRFRGLLKP